MNTRLLDRLLSLSLACFICFWLLVATSRNALGYVDPGSGLLALQTFASVMAACGFFLRRRLKSLFGLKSPVETGEPNPVPEKTDSRNAA